MAETTEPRALTSALAGPAFSPRGGGLAMHAADRHVERWAPEAGANRVRSLRSLGFVDRMIAPWIETAQRSASMRLFSQYAGTGFAERQGSDVSWVFPRPWYQDELDWMAAARKAGPTGSGASAPSMFTTRGTYVAPVQQQRQAPVELPTALYEYVAPSLSVAQPAAPTGVGYDARNDAYSPLVSLAAVQAASVMSRIVAPAAAPGRMSPALRNVLATMLERAAAPREIEPVPTRLSMQAPELVTPPAPRPDRAPEVSPSISRTEQTQQDSSAAVVAQYTEQRARIAEVQRIARVAAERELVARSEATRAEAAARSAGPAATPTATSTAAPPTAPSTEVRLAAQRAEVELRQRLAAAQTEEQRKQIETEQAQATAERARIEQRIAQRVSERTAGQRLHEQARAEAAAHARTPIEPARPATAPVAERRAPSEVSAAIAALPPELASFLGGRPDRAMQRIEELNQAFRAVELMARSAAQGQTFEATRGPRLTMPVGLGGLVSAIDHAHVAGDRAAGQRVPTMAALQAQVQPVPATGPAPSTLAAMRSPMRVPHLAFLSAPSERAFAPARTQAPTTALGATASSSPNGLSHVAWADRWLARFAGASQSSLDTLTAGSDSATRMHALADAAPGAVFVSPMFDARRDGEQVRVNSAGRVMVTPGAQYGVAAQLAQAQAAQAQAQAQLAAHVAQQTQRPGQFAPSLTAPGTSEVVRIADDAETPDDVFAEISAAVTRDRVGRRAAATPAQPLPAAPAMQAMTFERATLADHIAHAAPSSPGAGFASQLSSSPFAPALRHVLPMPSSTVFDVRALFGGGLSATYLAGLLAPASNELEIGSHALPAWASWSFDDRAVAAPLSERFAPDWDATYVSPDLPTEIADLSPETIGELERIGGRPTTIPAMSAGETISEQQLAQVQAQLAATAPLTTLRSALLSFDLDAGGDTMSRELASRTYGGVMPPAGSLSPTMSPTAARAMIDSMSLPMLGDGSHDDDTSWTAPGMIAERAHSYAVAHERTSSDLALDFVTPELVLAARVYGLGPVEAAQASRLALAGPGNLTAMAGTVDRTFVQAMAIEADRRERLLAPRTAYPTAAGETAIIAEPARRSPSMPWISSDLGAPGTDAAAREAAGLPPAHLSSTGASFGVDRRPPRGAFLWPSASISALGLNAAAPDGLQSMSVAALELLAAQAVAELGTYAALSDRPAETTEAPLASGAFGPGAVDPTATLGAELGGAEASIVEAARAETARAATRGRGPLDLVAPGAAGEPSEADVLGTATALVPSARRARFEALYVALSQSPAGASWSPAARAARALALAGRGEDANLSARERAMTAWDVLPVVYAAADAAAASAPEGGEVEVGSISISTSAARRGDALTYVAGRAAPITTGTAARRAAGAPGTAELVDGGEGFEGEGFEPDYVAPTFSRPGLGGLSARAGEALGSYVTPQTSRYVDTSAPAPQRDSHQVGAVLRAPTAAPELVQTGRPYARHGGGEVEIPAWFETAARKMFEQQGGGLADNISLADLTLISSTPSTHIAASTRGVPSAGASVSPATGTTKQGDAKKPDVDIEKLANEIYRHILVMMDAARARNGEPYL